MAAVALVEATAACVGSLISTTFMYPLEVTKTKVQAFGGKSKTSASATGGKATAEGHHNTMLSSMTHTYKTEGYKGLLAPWAPGWIPKLVDAGTFNFIFWFWFTACTSIAKRFGTSFLIDTITGITAAVINRLCTHPFENIAQRVQCRLPGMPFESMGGACTNIIKESGVRGLWKGLPPALILCINPSINMLCFFRIRRWWLARASRLAGEAVVLVAARPAFFIAMGSKSFAALTCYPLTRLKVMGTTQRKVEGGKIRSSWEMAKDLWQSDGILGFWYGAEGQIFNASFKQGITIMLKERLQFIAFSLFMPGHLAVAAPML